MEQIETAPFTDHTRQLEAKRLEKAKNSLQWMNINSSEMKNSRSTQNMANTSKQNTNTQAASQALKIRTRLTMNT